MPRAPRWPVTGSTSPARARAAPPATRPARTAPSRSCGSSAYGHRRQAQPGVAPPPSDSGAGKVRQGCRERRDDSVPGAEATTVVAPPSGGPTMTNDQITEILNRPLSQEMLARDLCRLAYVAKDGTPRNSPIAFAWNAKEAVMCTSKNAPKLASLRQNP